jgi:hypothetical protein
MIRKAEAGGRVSLEALSDIAEALSDETKCVQVEDLIDTPVNVVKQFIESYDLYYDQMLEHSSRLLSPMFVFHSAGDPAAPYSGTWHGLEGWQDWLNVMKSMVQRPVRGQLRVSYLTDGETVGARYNDFFSVPGGEPQSMWVNLYFTVRAGLICQLDNEYDTLLASELEALSRRMYGEPEA